MHPARHRRCRCEGGPCCCCGRERDDGPDPFFWPCAVVAAFVIFVGGGKALYDMIKTPGQQPAREGIRLDEHPKAASPPDFGERRGRNP